MNDGQVEADDYLIEIEARDASPPEKLNAAIAHFFEEGTNDIDTIRQILGPYLTLAGFYHMQVLESGEMPRVTEDEFREQADKTYTGSDRELKKFKLAHYLIQLEDVGLLRVTTKTVLVPGKVKRMCGTISSESKTSLNPRQRLSRNALFFLQ